MIKQSHLLIDETPTTFQKTLAKTIGLNAAIFLQQLQFWTKMAEQRQDPQNYFEGRWWMQASYAEWARNYFPFWSVDTIQRIVFYLEHQLQVIIGRADSNPNKGKWYAIDYDALERLDVLPASANSESAVAVDPEPAQLVPEKYVRIDRSKGLDIPTPPLRAANVVRGNGFHRRAKTSRHGRHCSQYRQLPTLPQNAEGPYRTLRKAPTAECGRPLPQVAIGSCVNPTSLLKGTCLNLKRDSKETKKGGRAIESPPATPPLIPPARLRDGSIPYLPPALPPERTPEPKPISPLPPDRSGPIDSMSNLFATEPEKWRERIRAGRPNRKQEDS